MKYKILAIILISTFSLSLKAQHVHEFSVNAGGGLSTIIYKAPSGKSTSGWGPEAGLGYHYFFSPKWGLGTGVNIAIYNSKVTMDSYSQRVALVSNAGNPFDFAYSYTNYEESSSAMMITIPLMAQFQSPVSEKITFYAAAGGKFGLPISAKYDVSGTLNTSAYFSGSNVVYYGDLPSKGFGTYTVDENDKDWDLGSAIMLSLETGAKWRINEQMSIYTGIYMDYGLNDIKKSGNLVDYNPSAKEYPQGFNSSSLSSVSDKVSPLAIGLKLRLSFGCQPFK